MRLRSFLPWVVIGVTALSGACTALAGVDGFVDVPCAEMTCDDAAVTGESGGDEVDGASGDADADVADGSPSEDSADAIGADAVASDTPAESGAPLESGMDSGSDTALPPDTSVPTDTSVPSDAPSDTSVPTDTSVPSDAPSDLGSDAGVCTAVLSKVATFSVSGASFNIDTTEVTRAQYAAFLAAGVSPAAQPTYCAFNLSYVPSVWSPPTAATCNLPVVNVDWCDARAYCAWAGRRLCGKVGGGRVDFAQFNDPARSEWTHVCTNDGATSYSYSSVWTAGVCVDDAYDGMLGYDPASDVARNVGAASACHGPAAPYSTVFDMSGNVREWEDCCSGDMGAADSCRARGGSFKNQQSCLAGSAAGRGTAADDVGFRCCSP